MFHVKRRASSIVESGLLGRIPREGEAYAEMVWMNPKKVSKMAQPPSAPPATRADVLAMLARRFRKHYGDRLVGLYATHEDPYEPEQGDEEGTHVVVVLEGPYEHWKETDPVTDITHDVLDETDWVAPITSHHVAEDSAIAKRMRKKGVRFD